MKSWSTLVFGGCLLAAIFSVNSHPAGEVTTAKSTSNSGPALVPPSVNPTSYTSDVKSTPLSDLFKDSTESDEKTSSTTAKTLFRRQAEDEDEDSTDESDGVDDDSDDDSDDRRRRDTTSTTTKGNKKNDSSESNSTEDNKETKVPAKPTTPKSHF